jgi:serine/threonine-protein kinase
MIARATACRPHLLHEAIANQLSAEEYDELSSHVDHCDHCRHELELLSGGSQWHSRVRECLSTTTEIDLDSCGDDASEADDDWRGFLESSDDPTKLGRIGKYEIESLVGRGGFGVVFKALDPELNRYVAVKLLSTPAASSATARKRFIREAQAAAAVVHDHVVPIHDVDTSHRVPFLVMPFLSGRSLQERLDAEGTLELEEILRIALQTARGLAAAHAQGLIHRDIKPANILLENGVQRVRISDFGLARAVDDATQTQSGFIAGTPAYMAPEQARGEQLDARADLFSLGSVIYAMCAGHPPFRAETTLAVLRRICDDEPRDVREHNPSVPAWLCEVLERLLAKSPDERFQSADEVADLLSRWLAHVQQPLVVRAPAALRKQAASGLASRRAGGPAANTVRLLAVVVIGFAMLYGAWQGREFLAGPSTIDVDAKQSVEAQRTNQPNTSPSLAIPMSPGFKPDAIQPELDWVWQATFHAAARLPGKAVEQRYRGDEEVHWLDGQLQRLEREIAE